MQKNYIHTYIPRLHTCIHVIFRVFREELFLSLPSHVSQWLGLTYYCYLCGSTVLTRVDVSLGIHQAILLVLVGVNRFRLT